MFLNLGLSVKSDLIPMNEIDLFLKDEVWILFPIVILANLMKDKVTYYLPRKFLNYSFSKLIKNFYIEIFVLTTLVLTGLFVYVELSLRDVNGLIQLAIFISVKLLYDFVFVKKLDEKSRV